MLSNILEDIEKVVTDDSILVKNTKLLNDIQKMKSILFSVTNTNSFMWMTINRCIDFTKASNGMKLIPKNETLNLKQSMEIPIKCVADLQSTMKIELTNITKDISENIVTDKQWLQENILCLVSNAVKYSTGGVVTVEVSKITESISTEISELKSMQYLKFEVEDTGIGLSETAMNSLFEPFKQAQRMAGGTGLGLFSLKKRMDALGGTYGVRNRKDGLIGSLFWFSIPYTPDDTMNSVELTESSNNLLYLSKNHESLRVLIVDDSPSILKLSSQMLRRKGFIVDTAENGSIGLDMIINNKIPYDIVLMDLQMPVMDGLESVRRLRQYEKNQQFPSESIVPPTQLVIGLSANSDDETINEAYRAGIDDFISNPFKMESFLQKLNKINLNKIENNCNCQLNN